MTEIEKLEAMLNKQYAYNFDAEEVEVLKRVINVMRGMDALGSLAGFFKRGLIWFGAVVATYVALKTDLVSIVSDLLAHFKG